MDYTLYTAEDFATDESFISYHLKDDDEAVLFWENWKTHHPEKLDEIYNAERLLDLMTLNLNDEELAFEFNRLESFLDKSYENQTVKPQKKQISFMFLVIMALLLIVSGLFWFSSNKTATKSQEIMISRTNPFGQRSIFVLSDGTKVTLNAHSTITFPKTFATNCRIVNLKGEAYFEVTKDINRPFSVKTEQITTKVLGTKFNVNTNLRDSNIQIALVEGKVSVSEENKKGEILLNPSQLLNYNANKQMFVKSNFLAADLTAWKDGTLVFKNASFNDVASKIYNSYGITLINNNKKSNWSYTGEFYNSDYLTVIKNICYAKKLKYKAVNDTIIIN